MSQLGTTASLDHPMCMLKEIKEKSKQKHSENEKLKNELVGNLGWPFLFGILNMKESENRHRLNWLILCTIWFYIFPEGRVSQFS